MQTSYCTGMTTLFFLAIFLLPLTEASATAEGVSSNNNLSSSSSLEVCEDFANRQIGIVDRLLNQSNYSRALKVLNRTVENCDREFVHEKLVEVFDAWYNDVRASGSSSDVRHFNNVVSNNPHLSSGQKARFDSRIQSYVSSLIRQQSTAQNYEETYQTCQSYPGYSDTNFEVQYYCGSSALELGKKWKAISAYAWMIENWDESQSLTTWETASSTLKELYFLTGRFARAQDLARTVAIRDGSPESLLASLISIRATYLSPILEAGGAFFQDAPSESALTQVDTEMRRIQFPEYVNAFYIFTEERSVKRGMHGNEATPPSASLLEKATGRVSLLQSPNNQNRAWLVSPIETGHLILEFGTATTPDETVRLESLHQNITSDKHWNRLYNFEFKQTSPTTGSGVATILGGAYLGDKDLRSYNSVFDNSPVVNYYCIQNASGEIEESRNFARAKLAYGDSGWQRTSNTPALYHHSIEYGGEPLREVVWPTYVNEEWSGVIRIGLARP